jgi:hypothetical protein
MIGNVLDDVLDGWDFSPAILSRRVAALLEVRAQFLRPDTSRL